MPENVSSDTLRKEENPLPPPQDISSQQEKINIAEENISVYSTSFSQQKDLHVKEDFSDKNTEILCPSQSSDKIDILNCMDHQQPTSTIAVEKKIPENRMQNFLEEHHKKLENKASLSPKEVAPENRRRPKTMSRREMLRERRRRERAGELLDVVEYERPKTRGDCVGGMRPCLFVACKHHLYLDVNPETGSIKINFPDKEVWELEETCALDVAERGGVTLEEVGDILNLTRERVRQVEVTGLQKLKSDNGPQHDLEVFLGWEPNRDDF